MGKIDKEGYEEVPLTEEQVTNKRMDLEICKQTFEQDSMDLEELEKKLDLKLPILQTKDMIGRFKQFLADGFGEDQYGNKKELTEADRLEFDLIIKKLEKQLELDFLMRRLRLQISQFKKKLEQVGYPGNQIKKLEREVREKKASVYVGNKETPSSVK
jgi:hypothetical protein